jgi:hypothetical protein
VTSLVTPCFLRAYYTDASFSSTQLSFKTVVVSNLAHVIGCADNITLIDNDVTGDDVVPRAASSRVARNPPSQADRYPKRLGSI